MEGTDEGDHCPGLLDLPLEVLETVADHLAHTRDRFSLALSCRALLRSTAASAAFWGSLAVSVPSRAQAAALLAWALPRRRLLRALTVWEPFRHDGHLPTAATLQMLCGLGLQPAGAAAPAPAAALSSLVWNVSPSPSHTLTLSGLALPHLRCLELDWMDDIDIAASLTLPAGFGSGLPSLTRLALSNVAGVRMAPACLPASLRCLSFENTYSSSIIPTIACALQPAAGSRGGLGQLSIRNLERRGIALSLEGLEALAPSLTSLLLQHPFQPDPLPVLAALTALRELTVSHATVTRGQEGLARLPGLSALALTSCAMHAVPEVLWALPGLQALDVSENYLVWNGLPSAGALTRLTIDLQYAADSGMQLGRLSTLCALQLVYRPADLPARLCATLPWLRALALGGTLRALELARSSAWAPGGPSLSLRDCPAALLDLQELAAASNGRLSISLSRY